MTPINESQKNVTEPVNAERHQETSKDVELKVVKTPEVLCSNVCDRKSVDDVKLDEKNETVIAISSSESTEALVRDTHVTRKQSASVMVKNDTDGNAGHAVDHKVKETEGKMCAVKRDSVVEISDDEDIDVSDSVTISSNDNKRTTKSLKLDVRKFSKPSDYIYVESSCGSNVDSDCVLVVDNEEKSSSTSTTRDVTTSAPREDKVRIAKGTISQKYENLVLYCTLKAFILLVS